MEVNVIGLARLIQLVLPGMREKRFGKIVNISSMAGKIYSPFGDWYHASMHALESLSDCLRWETKPFGIDVIIVEQGGINSPWGVISADNLKKTSGEGVYAETAVESAASLRKRYTSDQLTEPVVIAKTIFNGCHGKKAQDKIRCRLWRKTYDIYEKSSK